MSIEIYKLSYRNSRKVSNYGLTASLGKISKVLVRIDAAILEMSNQKFKRKVTEIENEEEEGEEDSSTKKIFSHLTKNERQTIKIIKENFILKIAFNFERLNFREALLYIDNLYNRLIRLNI